MLVSACASRGPRISAPPAETDPGWTPVQLSLVPSFQVFDLARDVKGLRLALLWSENRDVSGIDLSPIGASTSRDAIAIQVAGIANRVKGVATGVQIAGAANLVEGSVTGIQIGGAVNRLGGKASRYVNMSLERTVTGIQIAGLINIGNVKGLQIALLGNGYCGRGCNTARGWVHGVQIAMTNDATVVAGAQLSALASMANRLRGLQVASLLNAINEGGQGVQIGGFNFGIGDFSGLQIGLVNWAESMTGVQIGLLNFNSKGILPVFPFVNFGVSGKSTSEKKSDGKIRLRAYEAASDVEPERGLLNDLPDEILSSTIRTRLRLRVTPRRSGGRNLPE